MPGALKQIIDGLNQDLKTFSIQKVKYFFKNFNSTLKNSPKEAQYGYYMVFGGVFLILLQFILWAFA